MTAAAYAKSLLHQISPSRVKQEKTFSKAIDSRKYISMISDTECTNIGR